MEIDLHVRKNDIERRCRYRELCYVLGVMSLLPACIRKARTRGGAFAETDPNKIQRMLKNALRDQHGTQGVKYTACFLFPYDFSQREEIVG